MTRTYKEIIAQRKQKAAELESLREKVFSKDSVWLSPSLVVTTDNKIYQFDLKFGRAKQDCRFWEVEQECFYDVFNEMVKVKELAKAMAGT